MDGHSKSKMLQLFDMNKKNDIAWFSKPATNFSTI